MAPRVRAVDGRSSGVARPHAARAVGVRRVRADAKPVAGSDGLERVERELTQAMRRTVAAAWRASEAADRFRDAVLKPALAAGVAAGGIELAGSVRAVASGVISGVHDARGDLAYAAREIVRLAMQQAHLARIDVVLVARRAIEGIAWGAADAGIDPAASTRAAVRSALRTAAGLGVIAAEAVRVMLADALVALDQERSQQGFP